MSLRELVRLSPVVTACRCYLVLTLLGNPPPTLRLRVVSVATLCGYEGIVVLGILATQDNFVARV